MPETPLTELNTDQDHPSVPPARLIVLHGRDVSQQLVLDRDAISIGRADDNDLVLGSAHVSRHHARVTRRQSQYHIEDLESRNGVIVNGRSLQPRRAHALAHGDTIRIGDQVVVFLDAGAQQTVRQLSTIHLDRDRVRAEVDSLLKDRFSKER